MACSFGSDGVGLSLLRSTTIIRDTVERAFQMVFVALMADALSLESQTSTTCTKLGDSLKPEATTTVVSLAAAEIPTQVTLGDYSRHSGG
jgi:hypothetical protein